MELPRYIPLAEAAQRYNLDRTELTQAVDAGKIVAARINGTIVVAEDDMQALALDPSLVGVPIRSNEAADKYNVTQANLTRWADAGYIAIIERRYSYLTLDEATVKRAAAIFNKAKQETGSFVKAGYVLKRTMERLTL